MDIRCIHNYLLNRTGFVDVNGKVSNSKPIPFGCVQGSVLGPALFNIYTSKLPLFTEGAFCVRYADDTYIGISCPRSEIQAALDRIHQISNDHINYLSGLGMVTNRKKTEFIMFGYNGPRVQLNFGGEMIGNTDSIKILGVQFQSNLKWTSHVNKILKKVHSLSYSLKVLNCIMTRKQHKNIINSHVLSQLTYAIPIWGGNISHNDHRRLSSLLFKIVRLHCRDFSNIFSNKQLCERTSIRSLTSLRILADCNMLFKLVLYPLNTEITLRLIQQTSFSARFPNRLIFFDFSCKRIGRTSFINRSKRISELIPFEWNHLSIQQFRKRMKTVTPILSNSFILTTTTSLINYFQPFNIIYPNLFDFITMFSICLLCLSARQ